MSYDPVTHGYDPAEERKRWSPEVREKIDAMTARINEIDAQSIPPDKGPEAPPDEDPPCGS